MVRKKLQKFEEKGYDLTGMGLPTYKEYVDKVNEIPDYSSGEILLSYYKWAQADVKPGQEVGVCH